MTNDNFFTEENEAKSTWFKFEKIGDSIKGTYVNKSYKEARDNFPAQEVYDLQMEDGSIVKVGSSKDFVRNSMKQAKLGQIVGFRYDSDFQTAESKKKGFAPAKTIKVYLGAMDPNYVDIASLGREVTPEEAGIKIDEVPFN